MDRIIMLGTGHATVTRCYNTCFVVERTAGGQTDRLLVDGGGGNGILLQLERAGIVGPAQGAKPREVLITDEMSLENIISQFK